MKYALTLTMILSTAFVFQGCRDTETEIINEGSGGGTAEQTATVKGTVKASDGTLLEGVTVVSVPYGRDSNSRSDKRKAIEQIETDANGEFIMEDLNQGSYKLLFLASSYSKASLEIGPVDFLPDNLVAGAEGEEGHIEKSVC